MTKDLSISKLAEKFSPGTILKIKKRDLWRWRVRVWYYIWAKFRIIRITGLEIVREAQKFNTDTHRDRHRQHTRTQTHTHTHTHTHAHTHMMPILSCFSQISRNKTNRVSIFRRRECPITVQLF